MRASHSPGASTSAGVGRCSLVDPQPCQVELSGTLEHALNEGCATVDIFLVQVQAEQGLCDALTFTAADAAPAHRLAYRRVDTDEAGGDDGSDVLRVAGDRGCQRGKLSAYLFELGRRAVIGFAEEGGVTDDLGKARNGPRVDALQQPFEVAWIGPNEPDVSDHELLEPLCNMRPGEHRVKRHLVRAQP